MKVVVDPSSTRLPDDIINLNKQLRQEQAKVVSQQPSVVAPRSLSRSSSRDSDSDHFEFEEEMPLANNHYEYPLECWDVQIHAYSETQAGNVGLFAGLFGGDAKKVKCGVIHDAKRYSVYVTENGTSVEVGVAVRLSVATTSFASKLNLTLPNLAASAQLHGHDTRVGISVIGYKGALGEYLPAPSQFDVESCVDYLNAFKSIQKLVFGKEGMKHVIPSVLIYEDDSSQ